MQMEGIETFDRYGRSNWFYDQRRTDSRRCSPRLPTPEASRSSNGSLDEQIPRDYKRRGAPIPALLSEYSPTRPAISADASFRGAAYMRDGRRCAEPQSPPYQAADRQRPSLPPLKTVCGESARANWLVANTLVDSWRHYLITTRYASDAGRSFSTVTMRARIHSLALQTNCFLSQQEGQNRTQIRHIASVPSL